ncbi:Lecithin retinol acyltransferase [Monaibacterium marinum]|uniref:Lecithin retinol acyltransferase n=2 Tax=Pontivivens marinum TaxID=1690039 RepID=A0A2C9CNE6_9RHOB|nr:lecithin retinol acyltransferase family protein [Monaibacterium marinum]SOH92720.1 Lecithin retinol acyltransferase [Monaibacterium marinum]
MTVTEEPYHNVVRGRPTCLAPQQSSLPTNTILKRARSKLGKWQYQLLSANCEHFTNWATGLNVSSRQVKSTLSGAAIAGVATAVFVKEPSFKMLLTMTVIGGLTGLAAAQLPIKAIQQ